MTNLTRNKKLMYALLLGAAMLGLLIDQAGWIESSRSADRSADPFAMSRTDAMSGQEHVGPAVAAIFAAYDHRESSEATEAMEATDHINLRSPTRDAFALTEEIAAFYEKHSAAAADAQAEAQRAEQEAWEAVADTFRQDHALQGTFVHPENAWIIVDNRILRPGDTLNGFVLEEIDHYRAQFAKDDRTVELALDNPLNSARNGQGGLKAP
jgi:hypothetical protein